MFCAVLGAGQGAPDYSLIGRKNTRIPIWTRKDSGRGSGSPLTIKEFPHARNRYSQLFLYVHGHAILALILGDG